MNLPFFGKKKEQSKTLAFRPVGYYNPTLAEYLKKSFEAGVIDHSLRVSVNELGEVSFYIHPDGKDGKTIDIRMVANETDAESR